MKSLQLFWMQYADFSRKSDRKEFWFSQAWHLIIYQSILDLPIGLTLFKFEIRGRRDSLDRDGRFSLV